MEKARYNTELYSNLRTLINNVKPSNFWGAHQNEVSPIFIRLQYFYRTAILFFTSDNQGVIKVHVKLLILL